MPTRDWPSGTHWMPRALSPSVQAPRSAWRSAYSTQRETLSHLGHRLLISMTLPPAIDRRLVAEREAWLASLAASGDWVRLPAFHRPFPQGNASGALLVSGAVAAGASAIALTGARPAPSLMLGGSFEVDTDANGRADHMQSYITGSTGAVTYEIGPPLPGATGLRSQRITAATLGTASGDAIGVRQDMAGIIPGRPYTMAVSVLSATACGLRLYWDWMAADGTTVLGNAQTTVTAPLSTARLTHTATAPVDAASVRAYVWAQANPVAGIAQINLDDWQFEQAGAATAFAGSPVLRAGDWLGIGGVLHQLAADVQFTDAGTAASCALVLPARKAIANAAPVTLSRPTGTFQLVDDSAGVAYSPGLVQGEIALSFVEVF